MSRQPTLLSLFQQRERPVPIVVAEEAPLVTKSKSNCVDNGINSSSKRKQGVRKSTVKNWRLDYLDFEHDDDGIVTKMWCKYCRKFPNFFLQTLHGGHRQLGVCTSYIDGTVIIKKANALDHANAPGHKRAEAEEVKANNTKPIVKSMVKLDEISQKRIEYLFDIAYSVAYNELPFTNYVREIQNQIKHNVDLGNTYHNDKACVTFIMEINKYFISEMEKQFCMKPFYCGIMFDSSTDKAAHEKEIVVIRYIDRDGVIQTKLLSISHLKYGTADAIHKCLMEIFQKYDINYKNHLVAASADGAATNFGQLNGVMKQLTSDVPSLLSLHCAAHKLELALSNAFEGTYFKKVVDEMLMRVHYFYDKKSAKRVRELYELGEKMKIVIVRPPKASGTRWIDHRLKALTALQRNYPVIISHLEDIASGQRTDIKADQSAKAQGYLNKLKTYKFIIYSGFYQDIVKQLSILSKSLQTTDNPVSRLQIELKGTVAEINRLCDLANCKTLNDVKQECIISEDGKSVHYQNICLPFTDAASIQKNFERETSKVMTNIVKCLTDRFSDLTDHSILKAMNIFDLDNWPKKKNLLRDYGNQELTVIGNHFKRILIANGCIIENVETEWQILKEDIKSSHILSKFKCHDLWFEILGQKAEKYYPNIQHFIRIFLTIPSSSSHVERLFSCVKRVLGDWRLSLKAQTAEALVRIHTEGIEPSLFDAKPVVVQWQCSGLKMRRVNTKAYGPRKRKIKEVYSVSSDNEWSPTEDEYSSSDDSLPFDSVSADILDIFNSDSDESFDGFPASD